MADKNRFESIQTINDDKRNKYDLTPNTSYFIVTHGGLGSYAEYNGNVVHFLSMIDSNKDVPSGTVIYTMPTALRAKDLGFFIITNWDTNTIAGKGYIYTDGKITLSGGALAYNATNSKRFVIEGMYLI